MSGRAMQRLVDAAVGEIREALVDQGRVVALRVLRESDAGRRARWGEIYAARVSKVDHSRRGAFLDLGLSDQQGFLPLDAKSMARMDGQKPRKLVEGDKVVVVVAREAARGKSPNVRLTPDAHPGGKPIRLAQHEADLGFADARAADSQTRAMIDAAIEEAMARTAPIPGGGGLTIEPTSALVAIDVDAGPRAGSKDPERFALDLNIAAAQEAARQLRLRSLGGLVAIDFVSMRTAASARALEVAIKKAFVGDPWGTRLGALSKFGIFELSRGQLRAPLNEVLREPDGRLTPETAALMALRSIEREARSARGREVAAAVAPEVKSWLDQYVIEWHSALSSRIGQRWSITAAPGQARDRLDVRTI
jgi:ribonuclease E